MKFYNRKPKVVYIDVSREWAENRLSSRRREDDLELMVKSRLDWFDTDVIPVIDYFKSNTDVDFLNINGEQSIEEVSNELISKLGW